jgi:hypothetical protein
MRELSTERLSIAESPVLTAPGGTLPLSGNHGRRGSAMNVKITTTVGTGGATASGTPATPSTAGSSRTGGRR